MKWILGLILVMSQSMAFAQIIPGSYECKNSKEGMPNTIIKISLVELGGQDLPLLDVTRYYGEPNQLTTNHIYGFAGYFSMDESERLVLGGIQLEFKNGKLLNCQRP